MMALYWMTWLLRKEPTSQNVIIHEMASDNKLMGKYELKTSSYLNVPDLLKIDSKVSTTTKTTYCCITGYFFDFQIILQFTLIRPHYTVGSPF